MQEKEKRQSVLSNILARVMAAGGSLTLRAPVVAFVDEVGGGHETTITKVCLMKGCMQNTSALSFGKDISPDRIDTRTLDIIDQYL